MSMLRLCTAGKMKFGVSPRRFFFGGNQHSPVQNVLYCIRIVVLRKTYLLPAEYDLFSHLRSFRGIFYFVINIISTSERNLEIPSCTASEIFKTDIAVRSLKFLSGLKSKTGVRMSQRLPNDSNGSNISNNTVQLIRR